MPKVSFNVFLPFTTIRVLIDATVLPGAETGGQKEEICLLLSPFLEEESVIPEAHWKSQSWRMSSGISIWEAGAQETHLPARFGD